MKQLYGYISILICLSLLLISGCSDHGTNTLTPTASTGRGGLAFTIVWPTTPTAGTRTIPDSATTIVITVMQSGQTVGSTMITRQATTGHIDDIPAGAVTINGIAEDDTGATVAIGSTSVTVVAGQRIPAHLSLIPLVSGTIQDLGQGYATAINNTGQVVGELKNGHAFLWSPGSGMQDLGTLPGCDMSFAQGINDAGQVVGDAKALDGKYHAFLWGPGSGMQDLGTLPGCDLSIACKFNPAGQVVGWAYIRFGNGGYGSNYHAFLWAPGSGMQDLGLLSDGTIFVNDISGDGQVVGSTSTQASGRTQHAFLWTPNSSMQDLGTLPGCDMSDAQGINDAGQVAGGSYYYNSDGQGGHAFLWTQSSGMRDLGTLPGGNVSIAYGINSAGQVVGGSDALNSVGYYHAFLWTPDSGMRDLGTLPGFIGSYATAINAAGQVVGQATASNRDSHVFLWTPAAKNRSVRDSAQGSFTLTITTGDRQSSPIAPPPGLPRWNPRTHR